MSGALTTLLIDGNHQDRQYYAERLRRSLPDSVVLQAITGQSGLVICKSQAIDCVVLELDLPDMSGFEVLLKLVPRVYRPEIPVIILTRLDNPHFLKAAITNGAQAALYKTMASGDILEKAVLKAVSAIPRKTKEPPYFTARPSERSA